MIEYNNAAVGSVIKRLRKERGLTQEVLSGLAGIGRSHLAMIENNSKQANFETIWKLSNALNIPVHKLVEEIETEAHRIKTQSEETSCPE